MNGKENCAGCKWLDQGKHDAPGEGYCCMVERSNYTLGYLFLITFYCNFILQCAILLFDKVYLFAFASIFVPSTNTFR